MTMTPIPTPVPQRSDPSNFPARADAVMTALPTFVVEANALQVDVNNKQVQTTTAASNALLSEYRAAASAAASAASAAASVWVSGTTYSVGDARYSPTTFLTYRRKTNGAGTTDPDTDYTNWQLVTGGPYPYLHVRDEKPNQTGGGERLAGGTYDRDLNTIKTNTIQGGSLSDNILTLPAGTYDFDISAPARGNHRASLLEISGNTEYAGTSVGGNTTAERSHVVGRFTISATKTFKIIHRISVSSGTNQLGIPAQLGAGIVEVYTTAQFWKVA